MAAGALAGQTHWVRLLKITNPVALWTTVVIGLASLWSPVVKGVLQGQQNFLGLGWVLILDGVARFSSVTVILLLGGQAAGGMSGAMIGQMTSLALGAWFIRSALTGRGESVQWRPWLRRAVPLTLGIGCIQFMSNADVVFVQSVFPGDIASRAGSGIPIEPYDGREVVAGRLGSGSGPSLLNSEPCAQRFQAAEPEKETNGSLPQLSCTEEHLVPFESV